MHFFYQRGILISESQNNKPKKATESNFKYFFPFHFIFVKSIDFLFKLTKYISYLIIY
jgi:hypothetical protein